MRKLFLETCKYYCIQNYLNEDIFKMIQREDENLEYFVEIFVYIVKRKNNINCDSII